MKLSLYAENLKKQEEGSPFYIGDKGVFYIVRVGTASFNKQIEDIKRSIYGFAPKEIDQGLILATWLAEYGVTNWEDILDEKENLLEFSRENARRVFLNPSFFNSINAQLITHGSDYTNYLYDEIREDIEQIKKN